jgi:type IV pilus assembly protein PilW
VSAVADNIVHMRALYGVDDGPYNPAPGGGPNLGDGDGIVDRYVDAATFNAIVPLPWRYIIAVRVAVVARSALPEKPSEGASGCDATTDGTETPPGPDRRPKWSGGVFNLTADPEWKCYRYRVFETTVPLRNWIWRSN